MRSHQRRICARAGVAEYRRRRQEYRFPCCCLLKWPKREARGFHIHEKGLSYVKNRTLLQMPPLLQTTLSWTSRKQTKCLRPRKNLHPTNNGVEGRGGILPSAPSRFGQQVLSP